MAKKGLFLGVVTAIFGFAVFVPLAGVTIGEVETSASKVIEAIPPETKVAALEESRALLLKEIDVCKKRISQLDSELSRARTFLAKGKIRRKKAAQQFKLEGLKYSLREVEAKMAQLRK